MPVCFWRLQDTGTCISHTQWVSICMAWAFCDNHCCCSSLWRIQAIKMNDGDGFQSAGKAESCIAAESWRLQEGVVLVQHTRAWAALCSSHLKQCPPSEWCKEQRHFTSSLPLPPPDSSQSRSKQFVVTNHTDRPLKSEKQGWEVEGESTAGKNLVRQLETSLGNRI